MRLIRHVFMLCLFAGLAAGPAIAAPLAPLGPSLHAADTSAPTHSPWSTAARAVVLGLSVFGAIAVKDTAKIAQKFVTRAGQAAGDYKDGVSNAGSTWESRTSQSESSWEQGTQDAITRKAFAKGVSGKASKFQSNAVNLGSVRYAPGVANASDAYVRGVQPYLDRLKSLDLPPRGPRRSPQNSQRSVAVQMALGALKAGK